MPDAPQQPGIKILVSHQITRYCDCQCDHLHGRFGAVSAEIMLAESVAQKLQAHLNTLDIAFQQIKLRWIRNRNNALVLRWNVRFADGRLSRGAVHDLSLTPTRFHPAPSNEANESIQAALSRHFRRHCHQP